jgi:hypothetical protein
MSRPYGYMELKHMSRTAPDRQRIAEHLRRATFNPTGTDVAVVALAVVVAVCAVSLLIYWGAPWQL